MTVLLGFDPGGEDGFGWCVADDTPTLPLAVRATGVVDNARSAVDAVMTQVKRGESVVAVGIDAPLFWVATGDRNVDRIVRDELRGLGARSPGGTVQAVNSLRGACVVQGMLTGMLLRAALPEVLISESHPKALLWQLRLANRDRHPAGISLVSLSHFSVSASIGTQDHERDAAIGALCAWAMVHNPKGWRDLYLEEQHPYSPITAPLGYWMPQVAQADARG
jgi:predicted nuclease with RNAse H fold